MRTHAEVQETYRMVRQVVNVQDIMQFFGKQQRQSYKIMADIRTHYNKKKRQPITISEFCKYYQIPTQDFILSIVNHRQLLKKDPNVVE